MAYPGDISDQITDKDLQDFMMLEKQKAQFNSNVSPYYTFFKAPLI